MELCCRLANNIIKPTICFKEKIHYLCTSETAVSEMAVSLVKREGYEIF